MSKKLKIKLLLILLHGVSLIIFELIIDSNERLWLMGGPFHFIFCTMLAIYARFSKKIDKEYKGVIYSFPFLTYIFAAPMIVPTYWIAKILHIV